MEPYLETLEKYEAKERLYKEVEDTRRFDKWRLEQLENNKLYGLKLYRETLKLAKEKGFNERKKKLFDLFIFLNK